MRVFSSIACSITLGLAACAANEPPMEVVHELPKSLPIDTGDTVRQVLLELPVGPTSASAPVIMIFHGGGGSAQRMQEQSQYLARQFRARGFIVLYMNGTARRQTENLRTWNADHCCAYAQRENIDDVSYIDATLDRLSEFVAIDRNRVYLLGHSNGAMLAYRVAGDLSFTPAGIVTVSGAMFEDQPAVPETTRVLTIHTRDDDTVSFDASKRDRSQRFRTAPNFSFPEVIDRLHQLKACDAPIASAVSPGVLVSRADCAADSQVIAISAEQGGHEWPKTIPGFDLDAAILDFVLN
ncbi:MAG: hypothetical protein CMK07_12200 [Ponticaulis sp.]|nr:hypothetical protein [Ponticaulis sp.]